MSGDYIRDTNETVLECNWLFLREDVITLMVSNNVKYFDLATMFFQIK